MAVKVSGLELDAAKKLAPTDQPVLPAPLSSISSRCVPARSITTGESDVPGRALETVNVWLVAFHFPPTA